MTTLDELRERLEKAEGPDHQIDYDLWHEVYSGPEISESNYTLSLDDAIDLVEAVLPEAHWGVATDRKTSKGWIAGPSLEIPIEMDHTHAPIALLLALLSALEKESAE